MDLRWLSALGAVTVAACGPDTAADRALVRDSAGTEIVDNSRAAWTPAAAWRLSDMPVLEIGSVSSPNPAFEFSRIHSVTRLADGRVVVLEGQDSEVRWFDADGHHIMTRGGRGGGPGEFNFAATMFRLASDTIAVEDRPSMKLVYFTADGEYVRQDAIDRARLTQRVTSREECADGTLPDRSLLLCVHEQGEPAPKPDPGPGHLRTFSRFVRVTRDLDSIMPLGRYGGLEQWGISVGGRTQYAIHPWHSRTVTAAGGAPLRIAIAVNPEYSIELWRPDGRLERIIRRTGELRTPTAEERDNVRRQMIRFSSDEATANRFIAEMDEPAAIPAVARILIDSENHLWVMQRALATPDSAKTWDVFDARGRYLGAVAMPPRFGPFEIGTDYVLGVHHDELDVPAVRLYSLQRTGTTRTNSNGSD